MLLFRKISKQEQLIQKAKTIEELDAIKPYIKDPKLLAKLENKSTSILGEFFMEKGVELEDMAKWVREFIENNYF